MTRQPILIRRLLKNNIFRLSLLYSALFLLASLVMLVVAYRTIEKNIRTSIEREVNAEITRFVGSYQSSQLGIKSDPYAFFLEHDGHKLAGNLNQLPGIYKRQNIGQNLVKIEADKVTVDPSSERKGEIIGKTVTLPNETRLFIGKNSYDDTKRQKDILDAFSSALLVLLGFGVAGGLIISSKSIKRIDRISRVSQSIMAGNLDLRVPTTKYNDDLEDMARNINNMLDRIDDLMQGMRQVSNNIAHDLRTPLTRLRGNIETIAKKSGGEIQIEAEQALSETDNLLTTFASLLRISQVESGAANIIREPVNLSQLMAEIIDFYGVLAEEKSQHIQQEIQSDIIVSGDKNLISQAVVNLLTNAVKYTPERGHIRIGLSYIKKEKVAELSIHDSGCGVPDEELGKITQRFYRLEQHRNTDNGNGLGLPMVKAIVDAHQGELFFESAVGLKAVVQLPLAEKTLKKTAQKRLKNSLNSTLRTN